MNRYRLYRNQYKPNELGSLYVDENVGEEIKKGFRPVIYIGWQMEHRLHRIEDLTGITADVGHRLFNGSWFYEYSIKRDRTKSNINAINFADNLIKALEQAKLDSVDIITESYGGLIGACASKSPIVNKVVTIHNPVLGTPLANREMLLDALSTLEKRNRMTARIVTLVVDNVYGFEQDNAKGINDPKILNSIDFDKLTVIGSNMDRKNNKSRIACALYDLIYELTGKESDGVVLFDKAEFDRYGIKYIEERYPTNHFDAGSKSNLMRAAAMTLDGFDFPDGSSIPIGMNDETSSLGSIDKTPEENVGGIDEVEEIATEKEIYLTNLTIDSTKNDIKKDDTIVLLEGTTIPEDNSRLIGTSDNTSSFDGVNKTTENSGDIDYFDDPDDGLEFIPIEEFDNDPLINAFKGSEQEKARILGKFFSSR